MGRKSWGAETCPLRHTERAYPARRRETLLAPRKTPGSPRALPREAAPLWAGLPSPRWQTAGLSAPSRSRQIELRSPPYLTRNAPGFLPDPAHRGEAIEKELRYKRHRSARP